jgi:hydroxyacylglutathione hydrolase
MFLDAATLQYSNKALKNDLMYFQHVYDKTLAQASYFIGCQKAGVAAVIDPKRDIDTYLEIAKQNNMQITHVFETHIHADFLSGARELAAVTGAKMYLSDEGGEGWQYEFAHEGVKHGSQEMIGNLKIDVLHTPGHTPESISFLLTDTPASKEPVMLFTGDFVFVGDIGRPDLLEKAAGMVGTQDKGAEQMYQSINLFANLPEFIQVWPGHGAGSACGKALGAVPSTTVGYEKKRNWAFSYGTNKAGFIDFLLTDQPEPPKYFAKMKELNKVDRPLLTEVPTIKELSAAELKAATAKGIKLIDTRNKQDFEKGFIEGSINIQGNNSFATWMGWFVSYNEQFILVASPSQMDDLTRKLMRIGLDNIYGFVDAAKINELSDAPLLTSTMVNISDVKANTTAEIIDLRGVAEYNSGHIAGATNVFVGTLLQNLAKVPKDKPVIIHCQGGDRAAIGYSLLVKEGYTNVSNYSPGMNEWIKEGQAVVS